MLSKTKIDITYLRIKRLQLTPHALINNINISNINLDPILLNPKKINNFSEFYPLEYMYLDESITYDVVSIIKINN